MNLFVIDPDPASAARALSDQHVCKMILETAQILDGGTRPIMTNLYPRRNHEIVKIPASQRDNPCIRSASSRLVWDYAWAHLCGLLDEFRERFGKRHAYQNPRLLADLAERRREALPHMTERGFYLAMPDAYKLAPGMTHTDTCAGAVLAYRYYYAECKTVFANGRRATWTMRAPPHWLNLHRGQRHERCELSSDGRVYYYASIYERASA